MFLLFLLYLDLDVSCESTTKGIGITCTTFHCLGYWTPCWFPGSLFSHSDLLSSCSFLAPFLASSLPLTIACKRSTNATSWWHIFHKHFCWFSHRLSFTSELDLYNLWNYLWSIYHCADSHKLSKISICYFLIHSQGLTNQASNSDPHIIWPNLLSDPSQSNLKKACWTTCLSSQPF